MPCYMKGEKNCEVKTLSDQFKNKGIYLKHLYVPEKYGRYIVNVNAFLKLSEIIVGPEIRVMKYFSAIY